MEQERTRVFEGNHDKDKGFIERKNKAYKLYNYFHDKLQTHDDSAFDLNHISDVSDHETICSSNSWLGKNLGAKTNDSDEAMPDAIGSNPDGPVDPQNTHKEKNH